MTIKIRISIGEFKQQIIHIDLHVIVKKIIFIKSIHD